MRLVTFRGGQAAEGEHFIQVADEFDLRLSAVVIGRVDDDLIDQITYPFSAFRRVRAVHCRGQVAESPAV